MISSFTKKPDGHLDHLMHDTPASAHLQLRGPRVDAKSNAYAAPFESSPKEPFFASTCYIQDKREDWTNGEHARGVAVSKDGITIKYPGLYYVYCSLGFTCTSDVSVTHYVQRLRPESSSDDGVLLMAIHSRQHDGPLQGAAFWLDKGDKLKVVYRAEGQINIHTSSSWLAGITSIVAFIISVAALGLAYHRRLNESAMYNMSRKQNWSNAHRYQEINVLGHNVLSAVPALVIFLKEKVEKVQHNRHSYGHVPINTPTHTPVSAHLVLREAPRLQGTETDKVPNFSNKDHIITRLPDTAELWKLESHARGVSLSIDSVDILYTGLYYVYSCVYFKPNTTAPSSEFPYQTWFHYVHRKSPNAPMNTGVLLRSVYTACPRCNHSRESAYTGGIFFLNGGDRIQATLSGQGFIQYGSKSTFLGLFMLSV